MKFLDLVFDSERFEVIWSAPTEESNIVGEKIQDLFTKNRELTKLLRWASMEESRKCIVSLTKKNDLTPTIVDIYRTESHFHLIQQTLEKKNNFSKIFWNVFSQTFPGGLLFISKEDEIIELSHSLLDLLKIKNKDGISISKKSIIGESAEFIFGDGTEDSLYQKISKYNKMFGLDSSSEIFETKFAGKIFRVIQSPVFDMNKLVGSCLYFVDITYEIEQLNLIKNQELMLFQSTRLAALGEMAGGIAHEINNPLAIISSSVQTLKKAKDRSELSDDFFEDVINDIEETVIRITNIVSGLRTVSRESDCQNLKSVVLRDIFLDVFGLCSEKFKSHDVNLDIDLSLDEFSQSIIGDRVQISQVFINLMSNSYDAISNLSEKWIKVNIEVETDIVVIRVIDSGRGIPVNIREKIFDPFYTSKDIGKGTGLGLSISKKIIESNLGDISLELDHQNTSFKLTFQKG